MALSIISNNINLCLKDPNILESNKLYNDLVNKYYITLSEEEIKNYIHLLIKIAPFRKNILEEKDIYIQINKEIFEKVKSLPYFISCTSLVIEEFLNFIMNRIILDPTTVYNGLSGPRSVDNLKLILRLFNLEIPNHPKDENGYYLPLKIKQLKGYSPKINPKFNYKEYAEILKNIIMTNVNSNEYIAKNLGVIVYIWSETNGLEEFVNIIDNNIY
jgi:hypothetical protein